MGHLPFLFQTIAFTLIALLTPRTAPIINPVAKIVPSPTPTQIYGPLLQEVVPTLVLSPFPTLTPTEIPSSTPTKAVAPSRASVQAKTYVPYKKLTPTQQPTIKPTVSPTKTPTPTIQPTTTPLLPPLLIDVPEVSPQPESLDADYIFTKINLHRTNMNLAPFEKNDQLCKLASARSTEIYSEIYVTEKYHEGLRSRNIPYWIDENIASFQTEDSMINWWLNDYIHRITIEGNYKYSCVACSGKNCTQLFTSFIPKAL